MNIYANNFRNTIANLFQDRGIRIDLIEHPFANGYDIRLSKLPLVTRIYVEHEKIGTCKTYQLIEQIYTSGYKLLVREVIGLDIMMLGIDEDHGNGD